MYLLLALTLCHADPAATEALDEVNALRARYHLAPFVRDEDLTVAAKAAASYRAARLLSGHTANDFVFLPAGAQADAAGCAAWPDSWGWGACCPLDRGNYAAGAAWARGRDGKRYMHLFVRARRNRW